LKITEKFGLVLKHLPSFIEGDKEISKRLEDWSSSLNRVLSSGENLIFLISKTENCSKAKCFYPDLLALHQEWTFV